VIGFTRALSLETLKKKITVNAIAPGWVDTDMAVQGMTQGATHAKVTFDEFKDRQISAVPIKRIIDPAEVAGLVEFRREDLFGADFGEASVVTLYLLPELNVRLRPRLLELKPGTRIVSHQFEMGTWKPEKKVELNGRTIYFWTVPERKK
jgi:hypothetical protein